METLRRWMMSCPLGTPAAPKLLTRWNIGPREAHVALLLTAAAILGCIDLLYTLFANKIGLLNELNPLAEVYLRADLYSSFICYKLLMLLAGTTMLWRVRQSKWAIPACWILVGAHILVAVIWYFWMRDVLEIYQISLGSS